LIGFVSNFNGVAEFTPIQVLAVPEPASLAIGGLAALALLARRRRTR
jgi:hypothetical protein